MSSVNNMKHTEWPDLNRVQAVIFHLRPHCEAVSKPPLVS